MILRNMVSLMLLLLHACVMVSDALIYQEFGDSRYFELRPRSGENNHHHRRSFHQKRRHLPGCPSNCKRSETFGNPYLRATNNKNSKKSTYVRSVRDDSEPSSPPLTTTIKTTTTKASTTTTTTLPPITNGSSSTVNSTLTNAVKMKPEPAKTNRENRKFKIVKIKSGKIRGRVIEIERGREVFSFLGIPYGQSTTGDRRFKAPLEVASWENKRDTLEYGNSCIQWRDLSFEHYVKDFRGTAMWNTNTKVSEDCLYLNVWAPKRSSNSAKLAVMVWIYGGGFYSGTSSLDVYDGKWLAAYEDVVVVSINYRVGGLGFLALDDKEIPGNAGLLDQQLALKWVQENIHKFHGNPNNVTLFGESAGAVSIALQMMSEGSRGLFKNVILQSASALSPWSLLSRKEARRRAVKLAKEIGCPNVIYKNDTATANMTKQELEEWNRIQCLRNADPQMLVDKEMAMEGYGIARFPNAAVVDGNFLKKSPHEASIDELWNKDINVLAGFNANEGNYFIVYSYVLNYDLNTENQINNTVFKSGVLETLRSVIDFESLTTEAKNVLAKTSHFVYTGGYQPLSIDLDMNDNKTKTFVPGGEKFSLHNDGRLLIENNIRAQTFYRDRLDDMVGDINFVCPTITFFDKILQAQSERNESQTKTFLYKFVHRSSQNPWPLWMGVMHGYEIEFVFGIPLNDSSGYSALERNISRSMMKMWSSFAKHGNPNHGETDINWHPYNEKSKNVLLFGERGQEINKRSSLYSSKHSSQLTHCAFWREHFPDVQNRLTGLGDRSCQCPTVKGSGKGGAVTVQFSSLFWSVLLIVALARNIG